MSKKPQQTTTDLQRTLAGQWSKSEKRMAAATSIMNAKRRTHEINKQFKQRTFLAK